MKTPIVDGATLGSNFLVYSQDQVWMMEFVGGAFIFNFRKLFDDAGAINQNCIQEIEGKHNVLTGMTSTSLMATHANQYVMVALETTSSTA
mgnify:CR=1 FL=1